MLAAAAVPSTTVVDQAMVGTATSKNGHRLSQATRPSVPDGDPTNQWERWLAQVAPSKNTPTLET